MDKRIRAQGHSGRCTKQISKRRYSKKRRNINKGKKMTSKPLVVEETIIEQLAETNQLLTTVSKSSTISTDKVELTELPKDSYPHDSDLLTYPSCQMRFLYWCVQIEDKKKGLERFMQIKGKDRESKQSFSTSPHIDSTKGNGSSGKKTMEMNVRTAYGFRSIGVGYTPLTELCVLC